jgi:hypothetical protein
MGGNASWGCCQSAVRKRYPESVQLTACFLGTSAFARRGYIIDGYGGEAARRKGTGENDSPDGIRKSLCKHDECYGEKDRATPQRGKVLGKGGGFARRGKIAFTRANGGKRAERDRCQRNVLAIATVRGNTVDTNDKGGNKPRPMGELPDWRQRGETARVSHILNDCGQRGEGSSPVTHKLLRVVDEWTQDTLDALSDSASDVIADYSAAHWEASGGGFERLGLRIKRRRSEQAPPVAFSVEWVTRHPAIVDRGANKRKLFSRYVRKGIGDRYSITTLRRHAEDWQIPLIEAEEDRLAPIRRQARAAVDVRRRLLDYAKLEARLLGGRPHDDEGGT